MQIHAKNIDVVKHSTQCLVLGCFENGALSSSATAINSASARQLEKLLKREKFSGKAGQSLLLLNPIGVIAERLLLIGLGTLDKDG
jgi:leucyl aminopeptidase